MWFLYPTYSMLSSKNIKILCYFIIHFHNVWFLFLILSIAELNPLFINGSQKYVLFVISILEVFERIKTNSVVKGGLFTKTIYVN